MAPDKNIIRRAFAAVIAGHERQAQRFVARYEREHGEMNRKLTKW
jgi:hypothetical protein